MQPKSLLRKGMSREELQEALAVLATLEPAGTYACGDWEDLEDVPVTQADKALAHEFVAPVPNAFCRSEFAKGDLAQMLARLRVADAEHNSAKVGNRAHG